MENYGIDPKALIALSLFLFLFIAVFMILAKCLKNSIGKVVLIPESEKLPAIEFEMKDVLKSYREQVILNEKHTDLRGQITDEDRKNMVRLEDKIYLLQVRAYRAGYDKATKNISE